nr:DUF3857 domain-containing protein [Sphingomonas sp.]
MRFTSFLLAGTAIASSSAAIAADQLKFGPLPSWVAEQPVPPASDKVKDRPVALLLHDQQNLLEPGKISTYSELAFKIQKPEGLAAGNLSITWNPAFDSVTVNRLEVRRGNQVIDVLKSGQTFTTMRRESNLELAMLDGMLTANIQPEGLQEGDVVELATTTEHVDPVLKGHVEANFAPWGGAQIGLAHARIVWPSNVSLKFQKMGDLPAPQQSAADGKKLYELTMRDIEPVIDPKGAPIRFKIGRMGEASDFGSWADAARLMAPLYRETAVIPASGPLRDEVEKIRKASADPKVRAQQALQLVQDRVRYVALLMGQGGYVPASAETTWSRRFGDCKAKTALLLAVLHELGIQAEPVLANPILGDAIGDGLPMIGLFNHVLVRAHVANKAYWLDGTRSGDSDLDSIEVPDFGWGLPLIENAQLVHMVPAPRNSPSAERRVDVDATAGAYASAPVTIQEIYRGDSAVQMNAAYASLSSDQRDEQMRDKARGYFDTFSTSSSTLQFDKIKRELEIKIQGTAKLNWKDGWLYVPTSSIGFDPDFDRPAGPLHDVPVEVSHPRFAKDVATLKLPAGLASGQKLDPAVHETLAGVEYLRTETVSGDTLTVESSERSIAPEVPYKEALAAVPRLRALNKDDVYLRLSDQYRPTDGDVAALKEQAPQSLNEYLIRAGAYLAHDQLDAALADLNAALALDPRNVWALLKRAWIRAARHEFADADQDIAALESVEPGSAEVIGTRAYLAEMKGDFETATKEYSKLIDRDPKNKFAHTRRGLSYAAAGKTAEAIQDLTALIAADPKDYGSLLNRATIEAGANKLTDAAKDVQAALALKPNDPAVLSSAGRLAEQQGDYRLAVEYFSKQVDAQKASPYFPTLGETPVIGIGGAFAARANAYWILGDY